MSRTLPSEGANVGFAHMCWVDAAHPRSQRQAEHLQSKTELGTAATRCDVPNLVDANGLRRPEYRSLSDSKMGPAGFRVLASL